jgi:gas vesicle protein
VTFEHDIRKPPASPGAEDSPPAPEAREEEETGMSNEKSHTLMAFMLGAVAGGVTALLLAPASGRELREKIGEGAEKVRATTLDKAHQATEKVTEKYGETTEKARELAASARESAESHRKAVKEAFKEGKAAYERELAEGGVEH